MRRIDSIVLAFGVIGAILWVLISSKDGFKGSDTMILARSIDIAATIDGQVRNAPPPVGTRVKSNDLLVKIYNGRLDRSRLVEFESQIKFLRSEIANVSVQQRELAALLKTFEKRAAAYSEWMQKDVRLRKLANERQVEVAKLRSGLKTETVKHAKELFKKKHTSVVNVDIAKVEEKISQKEALVASTELERSSLFLKSLGNDAPFFENGDTSYFLKMADDLRMRHFDSRNKLLLLQAELNRTIQQQRAEANRVNSTFTENLVAPFTGVVNATFVNKGTRVTSGTNLVQVLNCADPVVIIPIPEHRISEFSVGMKVTVYPIDSEEALPGTIKYISSGPLIGDDKTIKIPLSLTINGNRAVVTFDADKQQQAKASSQTCETSRKAVAVVHTKSIFDTVGNWFSWSSSNNATVEAVSDDHPKSTARSDSLTRQTLTATAQ